MVFMTVAISIGIFIAFMVVIEICLRLKPLYRVAKGIGGPPIPLLYQILLDAFKIDAEFLFKLPREWAQAHKKTYSLYIAGQFHLNIIRAKDAEILLSSNKHTNKGMVYHFASPFLGTGLLTGEGKKWQQRRRILTPAFHFNILQQFLGVFREESKKLIKNLNYEKTDQGINISPLMCRLTLNTISETAMGVKLDSIEEPDAYRNKIYETVDLLIYRSLRPWLYSDLIYELFGYRQKLDSVLKPVHDFTRKIIKQRRVIFHNDTDAVTKLDNTNIYETKKRRSAMLDTLLAAEADRNQIDEEGIREEVDTFMFAGHDTTSSSLTHILLLLANHPDVQERVYEEIKSIIDGNSGEDLSTSHYNEMSYTDRVIKESIRLYPAVPFISRQLTENWIFEGYTLPRGTMVHLHIYDLHRDPEQFPDPEKFDPDRFLPDNVGKRHPFAYVPFSAGPRNCIGQKFALLEIKTVLQYILMNYKLEAVTKIEDVVFSADIVLRSKNPVKVKLNRRNIK